MSRPDAHTIEIKDGVPNPCYKLIYILTRDGPMPCESSKMLRLSGSGLRAAYISSRKKEAEMAKSTQKAMTNPAEMTSAMMAMNPIATATWLKIMNESAEFLAERLKKDLETQKAMLACKSPADLLKVQSDFYKTAIEHYTKETTRLFEMMSKGATSSIAEATSGHARGYDDVPL